MSNSFFQIIPAITLSIGFAMFAGCHDTNHSGTVGATGNATSSLAAVSWNASDKDTENAGDRDESVDTPSTASKAYLSRAAKKVEKLLSEGKFRAAEKLLDAYVPQFPADGGLYAMEAQLLLLETDIINDYTAPESRMHLITEACRTAVEFDPRLKPLVAEMLWRQVITDLRSAAVEQTPIIFADMEIVCVEYATEFEDGNQSLETTAEMINLMAIPGLALGIRMQLGHCMHAGGWRKALTEAYVIDPETSTQWSKQLRGLSAKFADAGLFASGMYVEVVRTYYDGTNQDQRPALTLNVLVDQIEQIKSSDRMKKRANAALDELMKYIWKEEFVALAKRQPADSKIRQLLEVLTE